MATVSTALSFPGTVHEAERCWYDASRWPSWVDGLERVVDVAGGWPAVGGLLTWNSGPAGRGRVTERVEQYEPLAGQTADVDDDSIRGRQQVSFTPVGDSVEIALTLEYQIKRRSIFTPLVDVLFIRRAMERSLRTTLTRFAAQLADAQRTAR